MAKGKKSKKEVEDYVNKIVQERLVKECLKEAEKNKNEDGLYPLTNREMNELIAKVASRIYNSKDN